MKTSEKPTKGVRARNALQNEKITIGVYITAVSGWLTFLISVWTYLPVALKLTGVFLSIFNFLTLFGIKKTQAMEVSKSIVKKVLDNIAFAKTMKVNDPWGVLNIIQNGLIFLMDNWNEVWEFLKKTGEVKDNEEIKQ